VLTTLLDLCDQLPAGQTFWIEGNFCGPRQPTVRETPSGERAPLNAIVAAPGVPPAYLAPACQMLGANLERTGEYAAALETYKLAEATGETISAGADCLLHATFINLHLDNDDEAMRLLAILERASPPVVNGAGSPVQIRELIALARTGEALACWQANRKWWHDWTELARALGAPHDTRRKLFQRFLTLRGCYRHSSTPCLRRPGGVSEGLRDTARCGPVAALAGPLRRRIERRHRSIDAGSAQRGAPASGQGACDPSPCHSAALA